MNRELLGNAIKRDRKSLGISQERLLQLVIAEAIRSDGRFTQTEKDELIESGRSYTNVGGKQVHVHYIPVKLISGIERGVVRSVSRENLIAIASILNQDPEKYFDLEVSPMKLLNNAPKLDVEQGEFRNEVQF